MPVTPEQSRADSREPSLLKNRKFDKNWNDYAKDDWSEQWTAMYDDDDDNNNRVWTLSGEIICYDDIGHEGEVYSIYLDIKLNYLLHFIFLIWQLTCVFTCRRHAELTLLRKTIFFIQ